MELLDATATGYLFPDWFRQGIYDFYKDLRIEGEKDKG